jgi:hypothetical protein
MLPHLPLVLQPLASSSIATVINDKTVITTSTIHNQKPTSTSHQHMTKDRFTTTTIKPHPITQQHVEPTLELTSLIIFSRSLFVLASMVSPPPDDIHAPIVALYSFFGLVFWFVVRIGCAR